MQHTADWGEPTLFDHLYRFVAAVLFGMVLYYESNLPHWMEIGLWAAAIAAGIGGLFAAIHYSRKWIQESRSNRRQREVAAAADRMLSYMTKLHSQRKANQFSSAGLARDLRIDVDLAREAVELLRTRGAVECAAGVYVLTQL